MYFVKKKLLPPCTLQPCCNVLGQLHAKQCFVTKYALLCTFVRWCCYADVHTVPGCVVPGCVVPGVPDVVPGVVGLDVVEASRKDETKKNCINSNILK